MVLFTDFKEEKAGVLKHGHRTFVVELGKIYEEKDGKWVHFCSCNGRSPRKALADNLNEELWGKL